MFERRLYFHVDWLLLAAIAAITAIGIAMIYSTTYVTLPDGGHAGSQVRTQVYALVIGIVAFLLFLHSTTGCSRSTRCSSTAGCWRCCCSCS